MTEPTSLDASAGTVPVVLFDLDGVLTRSDTTALLVTRRLKTRRLRLIAAVPIALLARVLPSTAGPVPRLNRALVALALSGTDEAEYQQLVQRTVHELTTRAGNVPAQGVTRVHLANAQGRAMVVTAAEESLARHFLTAIGLTQVELFASTITFAGGRARLTDHNVGAAKVARLAAAGVDLASATLYTDSASDLPLARSVEQAVLVNPTGRCRRIMNARLGPTPVVYWR